MARPHIPIAVRRYVIERAEGRCEYCLCLVAYATQAFDVDHIIPVSRDGSSVADNLAYACSGCNRHKYDGCVPFWGITEKDYFNRPV